MARLRLRPTERSSTSGYTLVEVMVAMLITSIMVTSVFSVTLTVKTGGSKGERKIKAAAGAKQIAALLKNFVTAETGNTSTSAPNIPGPNTANATNNWSLDGMAGNDAGAIDDLSCSNCYALANGTHTLRNVLPSTFEDVPYNARVIYFITPTDTVNGRPVPSVSITTTWDEP